MDNSQEKTYIREHFLIFVVAGSYLLHMLRNITEAYSAIPILASGIGILFLLGKRARVDSVGFSILLVFILSYFLPLVYSFLWYPDESYIIPFARYLYIIPFAIFCIYAISDTPLFVYVLKVFSLFIIIGGLSIFYQIVFGPILWFPEASEREGLVRFSSLVGSLTAYGIFGGLALPIIYFLFENKLIRNFSLVIVLMAMLCTLQKAAIANIVLFVIFLTLSGGLLNKIKIIGFVALILPVVIFIFYYLDISYVVATVDNILRFKEGSGDSDVPFFQSILDRLWFLPSQLYEMHGPSGMLYGVGMVGGSGTLGFPEYPMAHNGFFDLLFIGGILNLLVFTTLASFVLVRLSRLKAWCDPQSFTHKALKVSSFIYILLLINMLFAGPMHVQPYGGVIFYAITVFICLRRDEIKRFALNEQS